MKGLELSEFFVWFRLLFKRSYGKPFEDRRKSHVLNIINPNEKTSKDPTRPKLNVHARTWHA